MKEFNGITLIALIITIIVLLVLAGVVLNSLFGTNGIISTTQDVVVLNNIKVLEENIELYKTGQKLEGKVDIEMYPIAKNEDGTYVTLSQMKTADELEKLPNELKYIMLNLSNKKGGTDIPKLEDLDYTKFYKLDTSKLNISEEEAENLVIYIEGDNYKVINLNGVTINNEKINVIIPLKNEAIPEYITVANNTYKLYGNGTLKALGEKTVNSGFSSDEVNEINYRFDQFNLEKINNQFGNKMSLPAKKIYFSTGTAYVIDQNNDLWAWGANDSNKLGLGHSYLVVEPTKILEGRCEQTKVSKVWAGATNTFVLDLNGNLWGCGTNSFGELGIGKGVTTDSYVKIDLTISGMTGNDIKYMTLSTITSRAVTIMQFNNGKVYGMGNNGYGQLANGKTAHVYELTELTNLNNCAYVETDGRAGLFIDSNNNLYKFGVGKDINNKTIYYTTPQKIKENVKQAINYGDSVINGITMDGKSFTIIKTQEKEITSIPTDVNAVLVGSRVIIANDNIYQISEDTATIIASSLKNVNKYYEERQMNGENKNMTVILKDNSTIYVNGAPDITKLGIKSNYSLKTVFTNAIFVEGNGGNINIVDTNGDVYENPSNKSEITNVKKIISSARQKYLISNDNKLYAKGQKYGTIWGEDKNIDEYVQIRNEEGEYFNNVKNIYTSSEGNSIIIQTEDNKLYWGGNANWITLPGISGDFQNTSGDWITYYPKEFTSPVLEQIKNKIKDIKYFYDFANSQNIYRANVLILTEDGKLYTLSMNPVTSGNNISYDRNKGDFSEIVIKDGTTVEQIATKDGLSLAILSNGEVYGWGYNFNGILGPEYKTGEAYPTPVKISGLPENIRYMSLGDKFALFISKTGEVYGIGNNDYGQLGTGDNIGRSEFVRCIELEK